MLLLLDTLFLGFLLSLLLREQIFYFLKVSFQMWMLQNSVEFGVTTFQFVELWSEVIAHQSFVEELFFE